MPRVVSVKRLVTHQNLFALKRPLPSLQQRFHRTGVSERRDIATLTSLVLGDLAEDDYPERDQIKHVRESRNRLLSHGNGFSFYSSRNQYLRFKLCAVFPIKYAG